MTMRPATFVAIADFPDGDGYTILPPTFYDETGNGFAILGHCFGCKSPFLFSAETVLSIPIDPETNLPPDMGGDPERAEKEPLCNSCGSRINENRKRQGLTVLPLPRESSR